MALSLTFKRRAKKVGIGALGILNAVIVGKVLRKTKPVKAFVRTFRKTRARAFRNRELVGKVIREPRSRAAIGSIIRKAKLK